MMSYILLLTCVALSRLAVADDITIMNIPDGGKRYKIGQLYDSRTDTSISALLWANDVIEANVFETNAAYSTVSVMTTDSQQNRANLLGIDIELNLLKVAYGAAEMEFSGSFNFMNSKKMTSRSVFMAQSFSTRTVRRSLDIFSKSLGNPNAFAFADKKESCAGQEECKRATHFVSAITYGADVVVSYESTYQNAEEEQTIGIKLGGKLGVPSAGISAEVSGSVDINFNEDTLDQRTKVSVVGDVRIGEQLPTTPEGATEFVKRLPSITGTDAGTGVPMDVTLTPLAWVDSAAAKLHRKIGGDILGKLVAIYDSFAKSEQNIMDTLHINHGGFKAWKRYMDQYLNGFKGYQADFSQKLGNALSKFKGGVVEIGAVAGLEKEYWLVNNTYNEINILSRLQREEDVIGNLMALASEFSNVGITFAEHLRDYLAPTFNTKINRAYGLIMVGMNPNSDRPGIAKIRDFVALARSRHRPGIGGDDYNHCEFALDGDGNEECIESQTFMAIHFDSFCSEFCVNEFCAKDYEHQHLPLCPPNISFPALNDDYPFCWLDDFEAEQLDCTVNKATGSCGVDGYDINDHTKPFGDCWCACPNTQILQYVLNQAATRIDVDLPRSPLTREVTASKFTNIDPNPLNQVLNLVVSLPNNVTESIARKPLNYRIDVETRSIKVETNVQYITDAYSIFTDDAREDITVGALAAGETYYLKVAPMNEIGIGVFTDVEPITIGHSMPVQKTEGGLCTLAVVGGTAGTACVQPDPYHNRTITAWLNSRISITTSTVPPSKLTRVTIHNTTLGTAAAIDNDKIAAHAASSMGECSFTAEKSARLGKAGNNQTLTCTFEFQSVWDDESSGQSVLRNKYAALMDDDEGEHVDTYPIYLAVWDDVEGTLQSFGNWEIKIPSANNCADYGPFSYYCGALKRCVSDCDTQCLGSKPFESYCTNELCPDQLFCPVPYEFRPFSYKLAFTLEEHEAKEYPDCVDANELETLYDSTCESLCHDLSFHYDASGSSIEETIPHLCLAPCYMDLGDNYITGFEIERNDTRTIGCDTEPPTNAFKQEGVEFTFTCPSAPDLSNTVFDDGTLFKYDIKRLKQLENDGFSNIKEAGLKCGQCADLKVYDDERGACIFEKHSNIESLNMVVDGSFADTDLGEIYHELQLASVSSESADALGGGLQIDNGGKFVHKMRVQSFQVDDEVETGTVPPAINPKDGDTYAAVIYVQIPDSLKDATESTTVGTVQLGFSEEEGDSTSEEIIIPPQPFPRPSSLVNKGWSPNISRKKLGVCEGDCDRDSDCEGDLKCFHNAVPPGCEGILPHYQFDFCYDDTFESRAQTAIPLPDFYRVDIRHKFDRTKSADPGNVPDEIRLTVKGSFNPHIVIDLVEVVPIGDLLQARLSTSDLISDYISQINKVQDESKTRKSQLEQMRAELSQIDTLSQQQFTALANKNTVHDTQLSELDQDDDSFSSTITWNQGRLDKDVKSLLP